MTLRNHAWISRIERKHPPPTVLCPPTHIFLLSQSLQLCVILDADKGRKDGQGGRLLSLHVQQLHALPLLKKVEREGHPPHSIMQYFPGHPYEVVASRGLVGQTSEKGAYRRPRFETSLWPGWVWTTNDHNPTFARFGSVPRAVSAPVPWQQPGCSPPCSAMSFLCGQLEWNYKGTRATRGLSDCTPLRHTGETATSSLWTWNPVKAKQRQESQGMGEIEKHKSQVGRAQRVKNRTGMHVSPGLSPALWYEALEDSPVYPQKPQINNHPPES